MLRQARVSSRGLVLERMQRSSKDSEFHPSFYSENLLCEFLSWQEIEPSIQMNFLVRKYSVQD